MASRPTALDVVIYDCDGVLIDSEIIGCAVDAEMLTAEGYPITTEEVVRRFAGVPHGPMLASIEAELGRPLPRDFAERSGAAILARYRTDLKPFPDIHDALARLDRPTCVASSSGPSKLCFGLIETGLFDLFYPNVFSTVLVERGKPNPDIFLYAAEQMGARPERCLVVEDSVAGVTAGVAAGMIVAGFVGGSHCPPDHADHLTNAGAALVADNHGEIIDRLTNVP